MSQMRTFLLIELIVFLNIYWCVWAQTSNNETTTQLSGNPGPITQEMTQTPKIDPQEYSTTVQSNDLISINITSDTTTLKSIPELSENKQPIDITIITTTNSPAEQENQTQNIDFGNSSSKPIEINVSEEQTPVPTTTEIPVPTTKQTPIPMTTQTLILSSNVEIKSTTTLNPSESPNRSSKALDLSLSNEINDSLNQISNNESNFDVNIQQITTIKTTDIINGPNSSSSESSLMNNINSLSDNNNTPVITTHQNSTPNPELMISSSPPLPETTQLNEINSRQTTETSTHKPSAQTTEGIATTSINTIEYHRLLIGTDPESESKTQESEQTTQTSINLTESQTVANHYNILSDLVTEENPIDQKQQNQSHYTSPTEIENNSYLNASQINSTAPIESSKHSNPGEVETTPIPNSVNTSSEFPKIENSIETMQNSEHTETVITQTIAPAETMRPTTETIILSTDSVKLSSETVSLSHSEPFLTKQSKALSDFPETVSSTVSSLEVSQPKETTHFQSHSTQTVSSTEAIATEKLTTQPTHETHTSETQKEIPITESNVGMFRTNNSKPSLSSETTFKQPLTDHSLKTTQYIKPMTTSIPFESNISAITVTLPNIKYISSISKEDMVNIVTITFIAKSIDIFRWVSVYDQLFRNFTCNRIDPERSWCTIDRFVYLSPSPLVINNHLILNFFIDDSTDNVLNSYRVFAGPLIVEALKNATNSLETILGIKVMSLQTNLGTMVVKPLDNSPERLAKFELLVFIFTVVMFICTVLLCLAIICSCAKRKSVDMNQIQLSNCGRRQTINGGFDLNSASNILRDENQENKLNHNVINLDGWVAPIEQVDCEKTNKFDNLQDTKL